MSEAVIVATARSPIGRANKGSLIDLRPDDMSAQIVRALMAKVPQVKARDVEDLMLGIGQPAAKAVSTLVEWWQFLLASTMSPASLLTVTARPACRPFAWLHMPSTLAKAIALSQQA